MKVTQLCLTLCDSVDNSLPGSSAHGILQARILEWVTFPFSRVSFQPRIKPRSPTLHVDSLPVELPGKPKNTGVGSLALLQQIFPTQESNWGLLHYRWILYQLELPGKPLIFRKIEQIYAVVKSWSSGRSKTKRQMSPFLFKRYYSIYFLILILIHALLSSLSHLVVYPT